MTRTTTIITNAATIAFVSPEDTGAVVCVRCEVAVGKEVGFGEGVVVGEGVAGVVVRGVD